MLSERAVAMVDRVRAEVRSVSAELAAREVARVLHAALEYRAQLLSDDHDPRYLHTARCIRILVADGGVSDVASLSAAAFVESVDRELVGGARVLAEAAASLVRNAPLPGGADDDSLLERLVSGERPASVVALAERLDHARHLHMRRDIAWRSFHESVRRDYIPAARFLSPGIARRFEHWADAFERRLLFTD
jgi:hypothetical protein